MRSFARRLIASEAKGKSTSRGGQSAHLHEFGKLRPQLVSLMGTAGFRALQARALAVATAEVAWLRAVQVTTDGFLEGWEQRPVPVDPAEVFEGRVVLLACLLSLLVAFIGEKLTVRLVSEASPQLSLRDLDLGNGDQT